MYFLIVFFLYSGLIFGAFWFKNENKDYAWGISLSLALLPFVNHLKVFSLIPNEVLWHMMILLSIVGTTLYLLRYWKKPNKGEIMEVLKVLGIVQYFSSALFFESKYLALATMILGAIFIYTRIFQSNYNKMVKRIIGAVIVVQFLFLIVYSFIKANEAEEQSIIANEYSMKLVRQEQDLNAKIMNMETRLDSLQSQLINCQASQ